MESRIAGENPSRRKGPEALGRMDAGKIVGKTLKAKGGTGTPKLAVYRGHPWAISGFGEKRAIPFSARRVAGGGERKLPLIAC